MRFKRRKYSLISVLLMVALLVSFAVPNAGLSAFAAGGNQRIHRPTGYVQFEGPKTRTTGPIELDTDDVQVVSATNLNYDVQVGRHYAYLDPVSKCIYRAIVKASEYVYMKNEKADNYWDMACVAQYLPSKFSYQDSQFISAREAAAYDHPELCQIQVASLMKWDVSFDNPSTNEKIYSTYLYFINDKYDFTREQYDQMAEAVRNARNTILSYAEISSADTIPEKELAIHDWLCSANTYSEDPDAQKYSENMSHTAYSALVGDIDGLMPVCDGYSSALAYLLEGANIESFVITGNVKQSGGGGGHAWNVVKLGGQWYEVDSTWDDGDVINHDFFNLTTAQISNHTDSKSTRARAGYSNNLPTATGTTYTYKYIDEGGAIVPVTGLDWNQQSISATVSVDGDFTASVLPADATDPSIKWTSSNPKVLTVTSTGHYYPMSIGECDVTAEVTTGDNKVIKKTCHVTVGDDTRYTHTVSFNLNGATGSFNAVTVKEGEAYGKLPEPTRLGFVFDGWFTEPEGGVQVIDKTIYTATTDSTLYAHWTQLKLEGDNVSYEIDSEGNAIVTYGIDKKIKKIALGDRIEYDGVTYKIAVVSEGAFKGYKKATSIKLGRYITKIGKNAFKGCSKVKAITLYGNNLKSVGAGSFKGLKSGVKITVICKNRKTYDKVVKKIKKAGAKDAKFVYKKGK